MNKKFKLESFNNEKVQEINNVENLIIKDFELEQAVFKTINAASRSTVKGASSVLGINNLYTSGISIESNRITTSAGCYWPLRLTFVFELTVPKKRAFGSLEHKEFFEFYQTERVAPLYIDSLVKPSNTGIAGLYEKIFTSEFPGTFTIKYGRYVFCIDQLPTEVLNNFLHKAKTLRQIDLSWIAPLQDLLESRETPAVVAAVKKTNKAVIEDEEAVPTEISQVQEPTSLATARWGMPPPPPVKKMSTFHIPHSSSGLMNAITGSANSAQQFDWQIAHSQAKEHLQKLIEKEKLVKAKINKEPF